MIRNEEDRVRETDRLKASVEYLLSIPASRLTVREILDIEQLRSASVGPLTLPCGLLEACADKAEAMVRKEKGKLWLALYAS